MEVTAKLEKKLLPTPVHQAAASFSARIGV